MSEWVSCLSCSVDEQRHVTDCPLDAALTAAGYGPEERRRVREGR